MRVIEKGIAYSWLAETEETNGAKLSADVKVDEWVFVNLNTDAEKSRLQFIGFMIIFSKNGEINFSPHFQESINRLGP